MSATAPQRSDREPALHEVEPLHRQITASNERVRREGSSWVAYAIPLAILFIGTVVAILIKYRGLPF